MWPYAAIALIGIFVGAIGCLAWRPGNEISPWLPLVAAVVTSASAVAGVIYTQHITTMREIVGNLRKEKREAFIGALEADRDYLSLEEEQTRISERIIAIDKQLFQDITIPEGPEGDAVRDARGKQLEELLLEKKMKIQRSVECSLELHKGLLKIYYWLARVQICCSDDSSKKLAIMFKDRVAPPSAEEAAFILAARQDILS